MEEKIYTTEELLFELGISEHLFRKRLFHRGIITAMDGDFTLPIDYIDWAVFEYFEGMTKQHLLWTQKGHDNLLEIFGEQTEKPAFFSCIDIALELGISHMQLRKILVEKGIVQSMKGETTLTHNYQDWGKMVPVNGTNQVRFRWTEKGYDSILEMLGDLKTNSNGLKQSDNSLSQNMPNDLSVYTSDDISKALHISKIELRQFLVNKGIVRSMKGKIGVYLDYSDWGTLRFNSKAREKLFVWTEKGRENILKLYHSSQNESTDYMQNVEVRGRKQPILTNFSQLQKTFKTKYADSLLEQAKIGISLPNYALDIFPIDQEDILYIPSIVHPDGLLEKMNPAIEKDFESAVALYEAYPNLSPLQASDKTFWIYLAHTELFPYVRERYPDVCIENFDNSQYVQDYWFFGKGFFNHALAGLWWTVYFSVNEQDKESKYECTRFIFSRDSNFRTKYFASNQLFRHKEASIGILQFLMEDTELCSTFFRQKIRYIAKYFNKLGGTRQLISLNRDFFYHELKKIRPLIMAIQSDEDVKNSI